MYKTNKEQAEQIKVLEQQIKDMSVENLTPVVVAAQAIKAGTTIDADVHLKTVNWNTSQVAPSTVVDPKLIDGKVWKIDLSADSPVTADMVASEKYGATDRLQLVTVDALAPSLEVGDYIDIRMVTPYGINYVVMSKKRVNDIFDAGIELVMSEAELMIYSGLLIDQYMNPGTMVYASKYLEPTLQKGSYTMYVPPNDILDFMQVNANMLYPYLSSDNVQGLRAYIESTQPWTLYGPSTFQTATQEIVDKQAKITASNESFAGAMQSARNEYKSRQAESGGTDTAAGGGTTTQAPATTAPATEAAPSTEASGGVQADGSYVDSQGVTRNAEGDPVLNPSDLSTGVVDTKTEENKSLGEVPEIPPVDSNLGSMGGGQ